jgi:hypothetical protein
MGRTARGVEGAGGGTVRGRPRSTEPALAYDRRRYIVLVQVLAMPMDTEDQQRARMGALDNLAEGWGVVGWIGMDNDELAHQLAVMAIEYHRRESESPAE